MALQITDENVKDLLKSGKPVVVDFWAEWCGPCRQIAPIIDELATEFGDSVAIGKYNVDEGSELSEEYGIRNIPTLLFFKNGELVDKQVGAAPKATIQNKIKSLL